MRLALSLLLLSAVALAACDAGPGSSLYDPDRQSPASDPVVSAVVLDGPVALAGIDALTIEGENFGDDPSRVLVYFEDGLGSAVRAEILEVTPTRIRVKAPNDPGNRMVRVNVVGAENYSDPVPVTLTPAFVPFGDLDPSPGVRESPAAVVGDGTGAVYVSISRNGSAGGVFRLTPEGVREPVDPTSPVLWNDLTVGGSSFDRVFATQNVQAIFQLPGVVPVMPVLPSNQIRLSAISPDAEGRIWAGGTAGTATNPLTPRLYRFNLDGSVVSTEFPGTVSDIRVFEGYVYVAATRTAPVAEAKVWRLPIQADGTLGAEEVFYDVRADQPGRRPSALAIAADGTVFVGIAPPTTEPRAVVEYPVMQVSPDGSAEPLYPGVLPSPVSALTWGSGSELFLVRSPIPPPAGEAGEPEPAALYLVQARKEGSL